MQSKPYERFVHIPQNREVQTYVSIYTEVEQNTSQNLYVVKYQIFTRVN